MQIAAAVLLVAGELLKGQLHAHTSRSGDGATPPGQVARWYAEHRFDFVVFTDHERITGAEPGAILTIPGVELTQNLERCDPPARVGEQCLLHVNALFVAADRAVPWSAPTSDRRFDRYARALDATNALAGLAQLNHPTFHHAADGALVERLVARGLRLMEVANQCADVDNAPPDGPSTEAIWDEVLTSGGTLWGTATDDAHHFYDADARRARGEEVFTGDRGFVMVHAQRDAASIRAALERGDFYASTGLLLERVEADDKAITITTATPCTFRFIGPGGKILERRRGTRASLSLVRRRGYVRAVVEDQAGRRAYVQPVRLPPPR